MPWVAVVMWHEEKKDSEAPLEVLQKFGLCGPYPDEKTALAEAGRVESGKGAWPDVPLMVGVVPTLNADDASRADD